MEWWCNCVLNEGVKQGVSWENCLYSNSAVRICCLYSLHHILLGDVYDASFIMMHRNCELLLVAYWQCMLWSWMWFLCLWYLLCVHWNLYVFIMIIFFKCIPSGLAKFYILILILINVYITSKVLKCEGWYLLLYIS